MSTRPPTSSTQSHTFTSHKWNQPLPEDNRSEDKKPERAQSVARVIDLEPEALAQLRKRRDIKDNSVRTSKYTWWSFLIVNVWEQFTTKMANLYFLVIMFMQMIDQISISDGKPVMALPLIFVVSLSMIKDAYEDFKRHKADRAENRATTEVFNSETKQFEKREWRFVEVGDLVKVHEN